MLALCSSENPTNYARSNARIIAASLIITLLSPPKQCNVLNWVSVVSLITTCGHYHVAWRLGYCAAVLHGYFTLHIQALFLGSILNWSEVLLKHFPLVCVLFQAFLNHLPNRRWKHLLCTYVLRLTLALKAANHDWWSVQACICHVCM